MNMLTALPLGVIVTFHAFFSVKQGDSLLRSNTNLLHEEHGKVCHNIISDGYKTCKIWKKSL